MVRLRSGRPPWVRLRPSRFPRLRGTIETDVIIVGGGITGAIAASVFAEAGMAVAVVEANRIASGSTAASTALLMQEPDKDLRELAARYGQARARRLWKAIARANDDLIAAIRRARISCGLRVADSIYFASDLKGAARLRREFNARRSARLRCAWLSPAALGRRAKLPASCGILMRGNA